MQARSGARTRDGSITKRTRDGILCRGACDAALERKREVQHGRRASVSSATRTRDESLCRGMHLYRNPLLVERVSGNAFDPKIKFYFVVNAFGTPGRWGEEETKYLFLHCILYKL